VVVLRHAFAVFITHAEVVERVRQALRRGEAVPLDGFVVRLGHALAVVEDQAEAVLCEWIALLGCAPVSLLGGLVVDLHAAALLKTASNRKLR